ncbi:ATP-binding protein [Sphingomonas sp. Leaf4]|uniref:ATP-binding protein n=1 Tax=Sphingomonas sp. Leaf4 TaxID=2876553 RepID=UPI001E416B2E|nr:ATP-binding protein [Sphingomonas sp. Leaf4]
MRRPALALPAFLVLAVVVSAAPLPAVANPQFDRRVAELRAKAVSDPETALRESIALERLARRSPAESATIQWLRAESNARLGRDDVARRLVEQGLDTVRGQRTAIEGDLLRTRGDIATDAGDVASALGDYQAAHHIYVAHGNTRSRALALTSIASLYRQGGDFESALRYLGEAADIGGDPTLMASIYNNRGNVLSEMGRDRQALRDFQRAQTFVGRTDNSMFAARIWGNLARSQVAIGDFAAAWTSVSRGIAIARRGDSPQALGALQSISARIAMERGDRARAVALIDRIFTGVDLKRTSLAERDNHRNAYVVYAAAGDTAKALAHLEALNRLDDQATQVATSAKTALMSARFDFQNQELRIAGLKQAELRRNVAFERSRARFERILFGIGAGAVAVVIGLLGFGIFTLRRSRDEVRAANTELEHSNDALGRALAAKTEFLATTSHEIRTPLNGILGMTQVMLADGSLPPVARDRLSVVQGAGLAMRALVDDILDVAKMTTGKLAVAIEPTDPAAVLRDVARLWRAQAEERGLTFALDIADLPPWIESDPGRLRQIVYNLLSNALKFTADGGIALRASALDGRLRIAVADTGIGVPEDRQQDIFESFRQADTSTTRRYGGTGLGLTICRNLAQALGGDILLDSAVGRGSTFTLDLPIVEVAAPAGATEVAEGEELIVIEPNPIARGKIRGLLGGRVAGIRFADGVGDLIAAFGTGSHRCVLIDLPGLATISATPVEDLRAIATAAQAAGMTAIVLAAPDQSIGEDELFFTVLRKPVSGTKLISTVLGSVDTAPRDGLLCPAQGRAIATLHMSDIVAPVPAALRQAS